MKQWHNKLLKLELKWSRSVQPSHVTHVMVFVNTATAVTWLRVMKLKWVKQLVLWLLNLSVNLVLSLRCVRSIPVGLPETISHKVFLVCKKSLKLVILRVVQRSQKLRVSSNQLKKIQLNVQKKLQFKVKQIREHTPYHLLLS